MRLLHPCADAANAGLTKFSEQSVCLPEMGASAWLFAQM